MDGKRQRYILFVVPENMYIVPDEKAEYMNFNRNFVALEYGINVNKSPKKDLGLIRLLKNYEVFAVVYLSSESTVFNPAFIYWYAQTNTINKLKIDKYLRYFMNRGIKLISKSFQDMSRDSFDGLRFYWRNSSEEKSILDDLNSLSDPIKIEAPNIKSHKLNPEHTFNHFTSYNGNRMATGVLKNINDAKTKGKQVPIIIYSKPGMGKTHLLEASCSKLRNESKMAIYIKLSKKNLKPILKKQKIIADYLFIDDTDVFQELKPKVQVLLNKIVTKYIQNNKQVVLSTNNQKQVEIYSIKKFGNDATQLTIESPLWPDRIKILDTYAKNTGLFLSDEFINRIAYLEYQNIFQLVRNYEFGIMMR